MPEQVRCPSCNAALRVPDNLLGKNVKCPKCQTTFLAEAEEPAPREEVVREPRPAARRRPREEIEEEELPPEEELDELEEEPEEEEEERPRRRRRGGRRRAAAEAAVAGPAMSLIILGIFDLVLIALGIVLRLLGVGMMAVGGAAGQRGAPDIAASTPYMIGNVIGTIFAVCFAVAILMGGVKMKKLESYGSVIFASILALLPCGNCCIIGLPLGIWALVVLNRPEVKDSFR